MDPIDYQLARSILAFEAKRWNRAGAKVDAIRDTFGIGDTAYYQQLNRIIDQPSPDIAVEFGPLINRLRRRRDVGIRAVSPRRAASAA